MARIAGGVTTAEAVAAKPQPELAFIGYEELEQMIADSELKGWVRKRIIRELDSTVSHQVKSGYAFKPEVVVEGAGTWMTRGGQRVVRFEKIGRTGLAYLLDQRGYADAEARAFFSQFALPGMV